MTILIKKRNCTWLMVSLFTLLVLSPILEQKGTGGRVLLSGLSTFVLLSGIMVVSTSRRHLVGALVLTIPPLLTLWISHVLQLDKHRIWLDPAFYMLPFLFYLGWLVSKHIFSEGPMTVDRLHGAISLYLLLGLCWAYIYLVLERMAPHSFNFPESEVTEYGKLLAEFIYFSYITLTTLGYGEITPATPMARTACMLEAIAGVLFMGALVARIAGSLGPHTSRQTDHD